MTSVRILGLDPGTRVAGYGLIDLEPSSGQLTFVECGTLELSASSVVGRLDELRTDATELVREFSPAAAGLERAHVGKYAHAGLRLSEARGVLLAVLSAAAVPTQQYHPSQAKKAATGRGDASKQLVRQCLMRTLHLARMPKLDASDALALAVCRAIRWRA